MGTPNSTNDAAAIAEVRWFIQGDVCRTLRPRGRALERADAYHVDTLSVARSIKRRGGRVLEQKLRVGPTTAFDHHGLQGYAETWVKRRLHRTIRRRDLNGPWIPIEKKLWRLGNIQIARFTLADDDWWTIAVVLRGGVLDRSAEQLLDQWSDELSARGQSSSYPAWLLARRGDCDVVAATSRRAS